MLNVKDWFKKVGKNKTDVEESEPILRRSSSDDSSESSPPPTSDEQKKPPEENLFFYDDRAWYQKLDRQCAVSALKTTATYLPQYVSVLNWVPNYSLKKMFVFDIVSGITVGVMLVPQAMAYAILAGLPPVYGLYTAVVPLVIYGLLGNSKHMQVGPEPMGSVLLSTLIPAGQDRVKSAIILAFLAGVFHIIFGIFQLGFLDNVVSLPILRGFITAVAFIIGFKQLSPFLGLPANTDSGWQAVENLWNTLPEINWITFGLGASSLIFLQALRVIKQNLEGKKWLLFKLVPTVLLVVGIALLMSYLLDLESQGVAVIGSFKSGFPAPQPPALNDWELVKQLVPAGLYMSIVGMVASMVVIRNFSQQFRYSCNANTELIALGCQNIVGSFFNAFPSFGALGRSQVAALSGCKSQLTTILSSTIVLATLYLLVDVLYYLPSCVPAAIILDAAISLTDISDLFFLWRIRAYSDIVLLIAMACLTLILGSQVGVLLTLGTSILLVVRHTTVPHISVLGRLPESDRYKDITVYNQAEIDPGLLIIRVEENLYFANISQLKEILSRIERLGFGPLRQMEAFLSEPLWAVVFDCRQMPPLDSSCIKALKDKIDEYHSRGVKVCFVKLNDANRFMFLQAGIVDQIGPEALFASNHQAVQWLKGHPLNSYSTYRT